MTKCKKAEGHLFSIDTPTFFDSPKPEVEEYYQPKISAILYGTDDWFYKRTHVFVHLRCDHCQKEEHVELPAKYLQTVMMDPGYRMEVKTFQRLSYTLPDGEEVAHTVELSTTR